MRKLNSIVILLLIVTATVRARDAEFNVYGALGTAGWWIKSERFYNDTVGRVQSGPDSGKVIYGKDSIPMSTNVIKPFGTLGFKLKGDRFGSCIEMGARINAFDGATFGMSHNLTNLKKNDNFLYLKKWYVEWYVGDWVTLLAGQTEVPTTFDNTSNQAFNGFTLMCNMGCLYTGRYPMLQFSLHHPENIVAGKVAVIKPDTTAVEYLNKVGEQFYYHCETAMPKIEGSFSVDLFRNRAGFKGEIAGGYMGYRSAVFSGEVGAKEAKIDVRSWVVGGDFNVKFAPVTLSYDIFYGKNIGIYGVWVGDEFGWWRTSDFTKPFYPIHTGVTADSTLLNNGTALEMALILNVSPWENLSFEAGMGGIIGDHEYRLYRNRWANIFPNATVWPFSKFHSFAWYAQSEITVLEKMKITPEVGQYIYGPNRGFGRYVYMGFNTLVEF